LDCKGFAAQVHCTSTRITISIRVAVDHNLELIRCSNRGIEDHLNFVHGERERIRVWGEAVQPDELTTRRQSNGVFRCPIIHNHFHIPQDASNCHFHDLEDRFTCTAVHQRQGLVSGRIRHQPLLQRGGIHTQAGCIQPQFKVHGHGFAARHWHVEGNHADIAIHQDFNVIGAFG